MVTLDTMHSTNIFGCMLCNWAASAQFLASKTYIEIEVTKVWDWSISTSMSGIEKDLEIFGIFRWWRHSLYWHKSYCKFKMLRFILISWEVKLIRGFSAFQEKKLIPWQWINSKNILKGRSKWFCCLARFASISRGDSQRANTCLWNEVDCLRYQVFSKMFPTEKYKKKIILYVSFQGIFVCIWSHIILTCILGRK